MRRLGRGLPLVLALTALSSTSLAGSDERLSMNDQLQIHARETNVVLSSRTLDAVAAVDRADFVPADQLHFAYRDSPLPIGYDQTISQPFIVAYMTDLAEVGPRDKVLEVGTGSGYQAAI